MFLECSLTKLDILPDLCRKSDVLIFRETCAMPHDLHVFDQIDDEFNSYAFSALSDGFILRGRPYGGLTMLMRKSLIHYCKIMTFDDSRM